MSMRTVKGTYKDGKVTINSPPKGVAEARVLVTFLKPKRARAARPANGTKGEAVGGGRPALLTFGMFKPGRPIDEDDFRAAEWRGDRELDGHD